MSDDWWWRDALCPEIGVQAFYDAKGPKDVARAACRLCPVRQQCLTDALLSRDEHGIWGGFGRNERRRLFERVDAGNSPELVAQLAIAKDERRHGDAEDRWSGPSGGRAGDHVLPDSA